MGFKRAMTPSFQNTILLNKTALITGATRGLGRKIAEAFWKAGANLIFIARDQEKLQQLSHDFSVQKVSPAQTIKTFTLDLAQISQVENFIAEHVQNQKIDILINNAALQGPIGPCVENDLQQWQETLQVNLLTPVALCKAVLPYMMKQNDGKIINISGGGATKSRANFSAYAVSKAGLVRFSETIAEEVKAFNIRVNCIAPGMMNTDMLNQMLTAGVEKIGTKEYAQVLKHKDLADDEIINRAAELCVYLASDKSKGITGKLISAQWDPWQTLSHYLSDLEHSDIYTLGRILPKDRNKTWGDVS